VFGLQEALMSTQRVPQSVGVPGYAPVMSDLIADFYRQNEWANTAMIDVCRGLTDEQLDATVPGTYGSIRDTLHHLVGSEIGYAFRRGDPGIERIEPDDPWPGFDRLAELVHAAATAARRHAADSTSESLTVDPDYPSYVDPSVIWIQMVNHSTDHRSQINTILTTLGLEPADLSGWEWGLADGRVTCGLCGSKEHFGADH
jgi:uncharacterized damage-inducible protein DinB